MTDHDRATPDEQRLTVRDFPLAPVAEQRPPTGAPNVVAIVLDDTGFAQLGCYGSDITTPHIDGLAARGLRYNRFHVTALCSPTRASFFTGRNHHAVGMGFLADIPLAFPGYSARIPASAATLARILRDVGYATLAVGKWHLTPRGQRSAAGPFDHWPLGLGFERFYGFLQGDTNHWSPNLVSDNHYVDPPPEPGPPYHLSEDLAATAERMLLDVHHAAPGKPFFLYFALGATHAPHHVAPEWVEQYRGRFDDGWDAWRGATFERQRAAGVVPPGTVLTERPPWVRAWSDLSTDERRLFARQQEVFAGFLSHTDAQIGRVLGALERIGHMEDTLVMLFSDNGASAEGGQLGSVNEHRFSARVRESLADNLAALEEWGGPRTYNHYSWGWAWAGNTPLRLWKRYTWLGGTRTPLVIRWPGGMRSAGQIRSPFVHVVDLAPTVLDAVGVPWPETVAGVPQQALDGASIRATFDDPGAPGPRQTQYFEMMGSRAMYHRGWKATTDHVSTGVLDEEELAVGSRQFEDDRWELFDLEADFSESTDRAAETPALVVELSERWLAEARRNQVLPIDDTLTNRIGAVVPPAYPPGSRRRYLPGAGPIADEALPMPWGGFRILVDATVPEAGAAGILVALGDRHGGYALFALDGVLHFTFSRASELIELRARVPVPAGRQLLAVSYEAGEHGTFRLLQGDEEVASVSFAGGIPLALQHGGAGLRIGRDAGQAVSDRYRPPCDWTGIIESVVIENPGAAPPTLDEEVQVALHGD